MKTQSEINQIWQEKGMVQVCGEILQAKSFSSANEFWQEYHAGIQAQKDFKEFEQEQKSKGFW